MKTSGEVMGHPLWMLPVMLLSLVALIEGVHTTAHWHQEVDVHGTCRQNKEYIKMIESGEDDY